VGFDNRKILVSDIDVLASQLEQKIAELLADVTSAMEGTDDAFYNKIKDLNELRRIVERMYSYISTLRSDLCLLQ